MRMLDAVWGFCAHQYYTLRHVDSSGLVAWSAGGPYIPSLLYPLHPLWQVEPYRPLPKRTAVLLLHETLLRRHSRPLIHVHHADTSSHALSLSGNTSRPADRRRVWRGRRRHALYRRVSTALYHPLQLILHRYSHTARSTITS